MNVKRIMAGGLLWLGCTAPLLQGCLIPQDDQVLQDLPPKKNSPPRIVGTLPESPTTLQFGQGCNTAAKHEDRFSVSVEDPDLGDAIQNRWIVDGAVPPVADNPWISGLTSKAPTQFSDGGNS